MVFGFPPFHNIQANFLLAAAWCLTTVDDMWSDCLIVIVLLDWRWLFKYGHRVRDHNWDKKKKKSE